MEPVNFPPPDPGSGRLFPAFFCRGRPVLLTFSPEGEALEDLLSRLLSFREEGG